MSNTVKEYEARVMLTEEEYLNIVSVYLKMFPNAQFLQNTNIYFDSSDLYLRKNHMTLRVRVVNDAYSELTLKIKGENGDDEINDKLAKKDLDLLVKQGIFPSGNVKNFLIGLSYPLSNYHYITTLVNRRLEIEIDGHLLVIDKNVYGDVVDYNLEIETNDGVRSANKILNNYIRQFNLSLADKKYPGKASRAIKAALNID